MSFWGKLGKGLLKVGKVAAPIALGMTGVGLPAAMAVSGGLNALDRKVSGGSWKDALKAGAIGAGTAAAGAGAGKLGGWAGKFAGKMGAKTGQQAGAGYARSQVQGVEDRINQMGQRAMAPQQSAFQRIMGNIGTGARTAQQVMGAVGSARQAMGGYRTPPFNPGQSGIMGGMGGSYSNMGRGGRAMPRMDQRAPNLAHPIMRGRQEAIMNQPWRTPPFNPDPTQQLPNIYPNVPNMDMWEPQGRGIGPSYMPAY